MHRIDQLPKPPETAVSGLCNAMREISSRDLSGQASKALASLTDYDDTHPCLSERLAEIAGLNDAGSRMAFCRQVLKDAPDHPAAELLPESLEEAVRKSFDRDWRKETYDGWQELHQRAKEDRKRLSELSGLDSLSDKQAMDVAGLHLNFGEKPEAEQVLCALLERNPKHARASFILGCLMLERQDDECVKHLESALKADPDSQAAVESALHRYHLLSGRDDLARDFRDASVATAERQEVNYDNPLEWPLQPHSLEPEQYAKAAARIFVSSTIARAALVQLQRPFPLEPLLIFVAESSKTELEEGDNAIQERCSKIDIPGHDCSFFLVPKNDRFALKVFEVTGAEISRPEKRLAGRD